MCLCNNLDGLVKHLTYRMISFLVYIYLNYFILLLALCARRSTGY